MLLKPHSVPCQNPPRLQRRKRVTIIAGFYCQNGVLLCSDTEQSYTESKSQVSKLQHFRSGNAVFSVGGAGDAALCDYVIQDLPKYLNGKTYNTSDVENVLADYARTIFRNHVRVYAGFPRDLVPDVSFLIGMVMDKQFRLFKWERNFLYLATKNTSVGVGNVYSEAMANVIDVGYSFESMFLFAVRMMLRVKQSVSGCGGYTEYKFLRSSDGAIVSGLSLPLEIEHFVEQMDDLLATQLIAFISDVTKLDPIKEESMLENRKRLLKQMRENYIRLMPSISNFAGI
jgi:20S proteasome alpha/beta subunit